MRATIVVIATVLLALWPGRSQAQCDQCQGDFNYDGQVTIDELVTAVNNALNDCPAPGARFLDNGDGTITDSRTGLQWEKKSDDASIHNKDNTYTWTAGSPYDPNGTAFTVFLATLNREPCFAGHCDWRLPSAAELQGLVDHTLWAPAIDPIFNMACAPGCTITACSCTVSDFYWTSTPMAELPDYTWSVDLNYGVVNLYDKTLRYYVRAVRSGS
ncbi:MAG: DUF1566 domain-containing protein [Deltaproteobacteria bacterium]|nr:DUF1566 domain-containing protein [Deltaproteobacteria bacterium]